jgi:LmbE family N-acetylglucosaminyl deacetylase
MAAGKTVFCVIAHPDDEVLGVGGTLARHAAQGDEVHVCVLAETEVSRNRNEPTTDEMSERQRERRDATRRACDRLGVESVTFYDFPENEFDTVPLIDIVQTVEEELSRIDPEVVYTHHYGDLNISHELTCRAVLTAARPLPDSNVERILAFETLSSSEWAPHDGRNTFEPTFFVDISDHLDAKLDALAEHEGELRSRPHPRNAETVEQNAVLWGSKSGLDAAEPFEVLREVRR